MKDHGDDAGSQSSRRCCASRSLMPAPQIARGPTSEIVLNWAGFFVGLLIMTGDYVVAGKSLSPENWEFITSPKAMVWIFFVAGQFAFWANVVEPLWRWRSQLQADYGLRQTHAIRLKLAAAIVFFALPGFFLVYVVPDSNLAHHDPKMGLVNLVAVIVALIAVAGIWYVRAALEATFGEAAGVAGPAVSVQEKIAVLLDLRTHLQRFITLLGAMVALATLAKGALRQAILATGGIAVGVPARICASSGSVFHGAAGPRLHPHLYDPGRGRRRPRRVHLSRHGARPRLGPPLRWQANRKSLEELLQLQSGAFQNLRASVSILAPVATSVVTVLLGTK